MIPEHYRRCQQLPFGEPCICLAIEREMVDLMAERERIRRSRRRTQGRRKAID